MVPLDPLTELCDGIRRKFGPLMSRLSEAEDAIGVCRAMEKSAACGNDINSSFVLPPDVPDVKVGAAGGIKFALLQCRTAADEFLQKISEHQLCDIATYRNSPASTFFYRRPTSPAYSSSLETSFRSPIAAAPRHSLPPPQTTAPSTTCWTQPQQRRQSSTPTQHPTVTDVPGGQHLMRNGGWQREHHSAVVVEEDQFMDDEQEDSKAFSTTIDGLQSETAGDDNQDFVSLKHEDYNSSTQTYTAYGGRRKNKAKKVQQCETEIDVEPVVYIGEENSRGLKKVYKGYIYGVDQPLKNGMRTWRCVKKGKKFSCKARINDDLDGIVRMRSGEHNHPVMHDEIKVATALEKARRLARHADSDPNALVDQISKELSDTTGTPNLRALKQRLTRFRAKTLNLPRSTKTKAKSVAILYAKGACPNAGAESTTSADQPEPPSAQGAKPTALTDGTPSGSSDVDRAVRDFQTILRQVV